MTALTARQRTLIAVKTAVAAETQRAAITEREQRSSPITGQRIGYDVVTGDWLIATPDGGTIRAASLSNASLIGRVPIQRFGESQTATVDTVPSLPDLAWILTEMEALAERLIALTGWQFLDSDPVDAADARYAGDRVLNIQTGASFVWDATAEEWRPIGSTVLTGAYDPNELAEPHVPGATFWDSKARRLFIANPVPDATTPDWLPTANRSFNDPALEPDAYYEGDVWQGSDGTFYRYDGSTWQEQWYCPDCTDSPDPSGRPGGINTVY